MLKSMIVDDEQSARTNLEQLLNEYCDEVEVVASVEGTETAINALEEHHPDLLFLDIELQNSTGFELLEELQEEDFDVIFVTAYNQYAVQAFKFSAVDYLLKPINIDELVKAVERVKEKKKNRLAPERISSLMDNLDSRDTQSQKIALPTSEGLTFVELQSIIRCESSSNYTNFHLTNGKKIMVSKTIKHFENLLKGASFYRVHQSHLVNMEHIQKYVKKDGGYLVMSDDSEVMISQRRKKPFLEQLKSIQ